MRMIPRVLLIVTACLLLEGFGHMSFGDICPSLTPSDVSSCGSRNISKALCLAKGCCWNDTIAKSTKNDSSSGKINCYRSKHLSGTCIQYPEHGICFSSLTKFVPQFKNTTRFIDYKIGFNKTESFLKKLHSLVDSFAKDGFSETCLAKSRILLCQFILTPCSDEGNPIHLCPSDCFQFEEECPRTLQRLIGGAQADISWLHIDFAHVDFPSCKNLSYGEESAKVGRKCYTSGLFSFSDPPTNQAKTTIMIAVSVATALFVICLIFFLLYRRKKERQGEANLGLGNTAMNPRGLGSIPRISVKDHINKLCADDVLKSKISINDPKHIRQYPIERVAYEKDLGEGQFGKVFQGRAVGLNENEPEAKIMVAVKTLKTGSSQKAKAEFYQEACLMNFLSHPNIVKLLAVSTMEEPYCIIFEFMSKGDLCEYLRNSEPLVESAIVTSYNDENYLRQEILIKMSIDVANGLQYLASHRLVHRDVATRNCLVADDLTIKIADFGMSRDIYSDNYYKVDREAMLPIRWLPPESTIFGKFTLESDVYSYGVLLWEIFAFSKQPYSGYSNEKVLEFISKGVHLAKPDFCPEFVYGIMKDCWTREPRLRPHYHSIINRLNGKDIPNDQRGQRWSNHRSDTAFYESISLHQNELEEDHKTEDRNEKSPITMPHPEVGSHYVNVNAGMDLDCRPADELAGGGGNEDSESMKKSNND